MKRLRKDGDAVNGILKLDFRKLFINGGCLLIGGFSLIYYRDPSALVISSAIIMTTMYVGVVAYHRLIIHRSFNCPEWVEYLMIFFANLSGIGGPLEQIQIHDLRDWAQRKERCHNYFCHRENIIVDGWQQLFCRIKLTQPPVFEIEISNKPFYQHMEKFWFLYQLPLAVILYYMGGWSWVGAGIFLKIFSVHFGHWFIAHLLHNYGKRPVINKSAGVQGFNLPVLALLTFGESYHNNHHLCPNAAKNSFRRHEIDPAWWLIAFLNALGLARNPIMFQNE